MAPPMNHLLDGYVDGADPAAVHAVEGDQVDPGVQDGQAELAAQAVGRLQAGLESDVGRL